MYVRLVIWLSSNLFFFCLHTQAEDKLQRKEKQNKKHQQNRADFHVIQTRGLFSSRLRLSFEIDIQWDFQIRLFLVVELRAVVLVKSLVFLVSFGIYLQSECKSGGALEELVSQAAIVCRCVGFNDFISISVTDALKLNSVEV